MRFYLLAFDLCKDQTQFLMNIHQILGKDSVPNTSTQSLVYFLQFYALAFDLCKGHTDFLTNILQIIGLGNVPTSCNKNLVYFVAISSALYYPCSLWNVSMCRYRYFFTKCISTDTDTVSGNVSVPIPILFPILFDYIFTKIYYF